MVHGEEFHCAQTQYQRTVSSYGDDITQPLSRIILTACGIFNVDLLYFINPITFSMLVDEKCIFFLKTAFIIHSSSPKVKMNL